MMDRSPASSSLGEAAEVPESVRVTIRAPRPEKLAFRVRSVEGEVTDHPVTRRETVIGRTSERADLVVRDAVIDRAQCRFVFRDGRVEVEDLGSTCGTIVLGHKISRTTLHWGDVVRVGNSEIEVVRV